ncbi:hypothetical protein EJB05_14798, partial [Eragrostis curvula]
MSSPAPLLDELVEEILLRIPPDDPGRLVRAAVMCKTWCRLVSDPGFRSRFRRRHRNPPLLGILRNFHKDGDTMVRLNSSPAAPSRCCPLPTAAAGERSTRTTAVFSSSTCNLCYALPGTVTTSIDCRGTPFLVVFVGFNDVDAGKFAYVYSSKVDAWSEPTSAPCPGVLHGYECSALVGDALFFTLMYPTCILKYDLDTREITTIAPPPMSHTSTSFMLAITEGGRMVEGRLGCAMVHRQHSLHLWSREVVGPDGDMGWSQNRVIEVSTLLLHLGCLMRSVRADHFTGDGGVICMWTDRGLIATDLKSGQFREVEGVTWLDDIFLFMSFYTPLLSL